MHLVQGVRRDLPGEHRDPRQDPRHAAVPLAHGERLPHRARQHVPVHGELVERLRHEPGRAGRLGRRASTASRSSTPARRRSSHEYLYWVGCAGSFDDRNKKTSRAVAKLLQRAEHRLRDPRPERALHRRPRPPLGQRVHLPDAGDAEHRGARRARREEDHHPVPALLQHAEERVPAARRQLRGRAPLAAAQRSSSPTGGCRSRARRSTSGSRTTTPATSAATTTCTSRRATSSGRSAASTSSRCRATAPGACAAAPAARACGWRSTIGKKVNIERTEEALATGAERIAVACPFCYVMMDDGVKEKGRDEDVKVQDIAELLLEALENARARLPRRSRAEFQPGSVGVVERRKQPTTWSSTSPAACMNAYIVVGPTKRKPRRFRSLLSAVDSVGAGGSCASVVVVR